ncbi:PREDICTED: uncharacterized protein LOC103322025 [Prunus mume]|uniref:Uncharacterized protein LOC103322025 n=1 Tax=Prunus mume TaxID=102107 RepID=A0ABM0NB24_PRUMU|nr:PREDICTED: uncharacterized protein LOC103322025 [Prunus mume]
MGLIAKAKSNNSSSSSSENWGMDLLLVFFPEDNGTAIVDKSNKLLSSSSSSSPSPSSSSSSSSSKTCTIFRRTNSNNLLLSKAQSTISICALLVFITLLLFTLSTFEPTTKPHPLIITASRRFLSQKSPPTTRTDPKLLNKPNAATNPNHSFLLSSSWFGKMWKQKQTNPNLASRRHQFALQKMGTLYRRGTRAMADLVVGHVQEDVTEDDLRLFLRLLHRSGLTSKADVALIFASSSSRFGSVIAEEDDSFFKLIKHYRELNRTSRKPSSGFDVAQFLKSGKKQIEEPLWGKKRANSEAEAGLTQLSYGSVVGFEAGELDPENSLSGFLDHVVPMSLRRWACYPMLLGRVRRNFKHIMLVDVQNSVVLGDPLWRVRHHSPESVLLFTMPPGKHGKKNSESTPSHGPVNSVIITGGARGIRRLSNTVLTEIVRATMQHKRKNSVTESGILSQLVANAFVAKNINLITSTESIPDPSSLGAATELSGHTTIQRGNSNAFDLNSIIMKQICLSEIDSSVYRDC